jgi:hypothetical protein
MRNQGGTEYPPNAVHYTCAGLLRHLREHERPIDLFSGSQFTSFQAALDGEMKRLQSKGLGTTKKQEEVITEEEEELLWSSGQLEDSTPQQLLETMVFCCVLHFCLRRLPTPTHTVPDPAGGEVETGVFGVQRGRVQESSRGVERA